MFPSARNEERLSRLVSTKEAERGTRDGRPPSTTSTPSLRILSKTGESSRRDSSSRTATSLSAVGEEVEAAWELFWGALPLISAAPTFGNHVRPAVSPSEVCANSTLILAHPALALQLPIPTCGTWVLSAFARTRCRRGSDRARCCRCQQRIVRPTFWRVPKILSQRYRLFGDVLFPKFLRVFSEFAKAFSQARQTLQPGSCELRFFSQSQVDGSYFAEPFSL